MTTSVFVFVVKLTRPRTS